MANIDYSKSAVNMTNHEQIKAQLVDLEVYQINLAVAQADAEASIPQDIKDRIAIANLNVGALRESIRAMIDLCGSYQDTETGRYAVKQRKVSVSYDAVKFEAAFPTAAPLVITKAVNVKVLAGLIKGGVVTEDELCAKGVTQESESFAYIIKVSEPVPAPVVKEKA